MKIIRQYSTDSKRCVIRTNTYISDLSHFMILFEEAKKDFPDLKIDEVKVEHYGGERHKGIFGIEFDRPEEMVPETYTRMKRLECTL